MKYMGYEISPEPARQKRQQFAYPATSNIINRYLAEMERLEHRIEKEKIHALQNLWRSVDSPRDSR